MYTANNVANYILRYYNSKDVWISNLKLQKILYFLQAQFMVSRGYPLFSDPIRAVDWGPMIENVYHNYKIFGSASIPVIHEEKYPYDIDGKDMLLIAEVLDYMEPYSATTLLSFIHNQPPWKNAYYGHRKYISNNELRDFFKN